MHLVVFEGMCWRALAPITFSRPVFSLVSGCGTLLDRQIRTLRPSRLTLWVRPEMVNFCRQEIVPKLSIPTQINTPLDEEPALLLSGRSLHCGKYPPADEPFVVLDERGICIAYTRSSPGLSPKDALQRSDAWLALHELPNINTESRRAGYLWDLLADNGHAIVEDLELSRGLGLRSAPKQAGAYHMVSEENIWLGQDAQLGAGCVLDASKGPVIIGDGAVIGPNAVLQGPCCIGPDTQVTALAYIRSGTSTGPRCKIGGEISNSILTAHTNKPHDGYLGDSYLGEWVNFGAGATTSNLKNTYGPIDMAIGSKSIPTGRQFLGSLVGDHTKIAIGTRLMTGTYLGYCSMIATSKLPPTHVPSFSFLTDKGLLSYQKDKAREVMTAVYRRRGKEWDPMDQEMLDYVAGAASDVES